MAGPPDLPRILIYSLPDLDAWFEQNAANCSGVLFQISKAKVSPATVGYEDILDRALCWGWIDSQKFGLDDQFWLQKFGPRRRGGLWSLKNRNSVERLLAEGRMQPAGLAAVEEAKANGRWEAAYTGQGINTVPEDLVAALALNPSAQAFFSEMDAANRYAVVFRVLTAKPEKRAQKVAELVQRLAEGRALHR